MTNIDDISILFESLSPAILNFFEEGFIETERTDSVKNADWLLGETLEVFGDSSSTMTEQKASRVLAKHRRKKRSGKVQNRQVVLKMLAVNWLYGNNYDGTSQGVGNLVTALAKAPHETLFSTDLVITLVDSFWDRYRSAMLWRCFFPFISYFFTTILYFIFHLGKVDAGWDWRSPATY